MEIEWELVIDALAQARNNPDKFIRECFGEESTLAAFPDLAPFGHKFRAMQHNPIKFYKSLDLAYRREMETWLTKIMAETKRRYA